MNWMAKWIRPQKEMGEICPIFEKEFSIEKTVKNAKLAMTALGVYEAYLNEKRIGDFILAPGWTTYEKRLQYQVYDVTDLLVSHNKLSVTVGKGWYGGRLPGWIDRKNTESLAYPSSSLLAQLTVTYEDNTTEIISTDENWLVGESQIRSSEIYDGELFDASSVLKVNQPVSCFQGPFSILIPQEGEEIREQESLQAATIFQTPKGELVIDFGQEITGYVEVSITAKAGEEVMLSFAEVLDQQGNFYTENYRSAKALYHYICKEGQQTYKPRLTFYGFRYLRIDRFPGGVSLATPDNFRAIVVHSELERTGYLSCSNSLLNKLFSNIIWGQKGNFLDVPTDCPQRDERLGWTGDAQAFVRTAAYNYNVERFFTKWLADLSAEQTEEGRVPHVVPDVLDEGGSAAWGDAVTICPWEIYLAYGNPEILKRQYSSMTKWIDYITASTNDSYLWTGGTHFGDWLGLDAPSGSYKGSSREDFIASAFYAHSTWLVMKAGKVLGEDVSKWEALYKEIVSTFQKTFSTYTTQTECVLAAHFHLARDCQKAADQLATMIKEAGTRLQTGFVGTPYILHVLSTYGYHEMAYSLLLREQYPSWLYPVTKGATTIWEHWDGIMENGDFWSANMNSYNHYAYGAVADWVYSTAAGIAPIETSPGYEMVSISPIPDPRLDWLKASLHTKHGLICSEWKKEDGKWRYEILTPVDAIITIAGCTKQVPKGSYIFYSPLHSSL